MAKPVIMLAAGGTGGHIFPALAVGEYLTDQGWTPVFVTDKRGRHMIPQGLKTITISAASPFASRLHLRLWRLFRLARDCFHLWGLFYFADPKQLLVLVVILLSHLSLLLMGLACR